jgi:rhodanese-related sulfurtransferase
LPQREPGEPYFWIDADEAAEMYGDDDVVFIDVRRPDEYATGHITNALFIPVDDVLERFDELPKDKKLLFVCTAGARSGLACEMAAAMGIDTEMLYNIVEDTSVWITKGYPTSYGSVQ